MTDLSVIIPTRNRAPLLRRLLEALADQTLSADRFEVIVVDNGSTDATSAVAAELRERVAYPLRYVREETPGLHRGRHMGMRVARAELLVFGDDDIIPLPTWLEAVHGAFTEQEIVLVGGKNLPDWEVPPPPWLARMWDDTRRIPLLSILDLRDERRDVDPCEIWGCNFSIRKRVLLEARGFHPDGMPAGMLQFRGDGETYVSRFVAAAGLRAVYEPKAAVLHTVTAERMTVEYFQRRAFAEGVSRSFAGLRSANAPPPLHLRAIVSIFSFLTWLAPGNWLLRALLPWRLYLRLLLAAASRRGFLWHRALFTTDPAVREWVQRADFLE